MLTLTAVAVASAYAQELELREYEKRDLVKKKFWPSRLGDKEDRKCESCEEREAKSRMKYLSRVLEESDASDYQSDVRDRVLDDNKFVKKCWDRLSPKGVEVFFTVNAQGEAEDLATFPKRVLTKCLKRRLAKLDYPSPEKPTHIWLVLSDL